MEIMYDEEMLQEINDNVDLYEYVSQDISLSKRGKKYFGRCPLHADKTPSFSITPEINRFFCFSCGRGGGIIQYLRYYEKMKYPQAVEKASRLAQIDLRKMCQSPTVLFNKKARKLGQREEPVLHTILSRDELKRFRKGQVTEWLKEGIRQEEIDLFEIMLDDKSNRIVYPVYDVDGQLINIKGRTMFDDYKALGIQKYINYYPVGVVDYFQGLNVALPYIRETGEMKIFEGIKSVMKLYGNGVRDSVSAEKHNLTAEQVKWIISQDYIKNVVLCWDSDVSYKEPDVKRNIADLKRFVNVYVLEDRQNLLGGKEGKNSPIDKGIETWNKLYSERRKIR